MCCWKLVFCFLISGALYVGAASLPKEVVTARESFEIGLHQVVCDSEKRVTATGEEYLERLRAIEREMQSNGQFRGLVTVHDEIVRFTKERTLVGQPLAELVELRKAQASFQAKLMQEQYDDGCALLQLAGRYVQALALARETVEKQGAAAGVRELNEERDRVIGLAKLRAALETTKAHAPTAEVAPAKVKTVADERVRRQLDICRPAAEPLQAMIGYNLRASLLEDVSKLNQRRAEGANGKVNSLEGQIGYVPHIVLSCQHGEVPSGSRLVIEYFSRSLTSHSHRRETVESVLLPRLDHGESYTVEAKGIQLFRSEQITATMRVGVSRNFTGSEFYGLILHVVNPDGHVLVQRFTPQALARELSATPPEK